MLQKEETHEGLTKQPLVYEKVQRNVRSSQEKIRKRKMEKGWEDNFQVGDKVLKCNIREQQRKGGKMERDMLGPFTIIQLEGKVASLKGMKNQNTIANVDQLTPFIEPEERIPAKLLHLRKSPLAPPSPKRCCTPPSPSPATTMKGSDPIYGNDAYQSM